MEGNIEEKVWFFEPRLSPKLDTEISVVESWLPRERKKTVSVALVICLNVGVDPPDVVKPNPCARKECWLDPMALSQQRALEEIGNTLQKQYERWQQRARYKLSLDPTVEDVKKLCLSLRKNSKEERVLFHYNGHGVPKPTTNGEIWVFNKTYTQYIPLSIFDLQTWMGAPSIYVYDCNNAAMIIESFLKFAEQHDAEYKDSVAKSRHPTGANPPNLPSTASGQHDQTSAQVAGNGSSSALDGLDAGNVESGGCPSTSGPPNFRECIQLAACQKDQLLPMNPELPADLFTCCLTTPIKIAVLWYILKNKFECKLDVEDTDRIPGTIPDRRTMLGELNWIFTAITDTIAWNTLPPELFQKLFRQDLLVASLFRNFLLANRIMRAYHCTPMSHPALPDTHEHPLWPAWDYALDVCIGQLPAILKAESENKKVDYVHSTFFESQLSAFQVWLDYGSHKRTAPQQLPIVLQVLLSQAHRLRALELLGRFLDLGPWAVTLALSVGIFPYVLRLLHSGVRELRPLLSFIWAKILTVQRVSQADLVKDGGHKYFLQILSDPTSTVREKTISAFIIATIVDNFERGQEAVMKEGYIVKSTELLGDLRESLGNGGPNCYLLRQWLCIGLAKVWANYDAARWYAIRNTAYDGLFNVLCDDPVPEVRAAVVHALGTLVSNRSSTNQHATYVDQQIVSTLCNNAHCDGSPLVRKELVVALGWFISDFESFFVSAVQEIMEPIFHKARQLDYEHVERLEELVNRRRSSLIHENSSNQSISRSPGSMTNSVISSASTKDNVANKSSLNRKYNSEDTKSWIASAEEDEIENEDCGGDYFDATQSSTLSRLPVKNSINLSVIRKCPSDDQLQHSGTAATATTSANDFVVNRTRNTAAKKVDSTAGSSHRRQKSAIDATASGTTGSGEKLEAIVSSNLGSFYPHQPAKVKKSNSARNLAFLGRGNSPPTAGQPSPLANLMNSGMSSSISTLFRQNIPNVVGRSPGRNQRANSLFMGNAPPRPPQDHREIEEMVEEASEKKLRSTNSGLANVRSIYPSVWLRLVNLATLDPDKEVRHLAQQIREHVNRAAYAHLISKLTTATVQVQLAVTELFPDGIPASDFASLGHVGLPLHCRRSGGGARTISESSTGSDTDAAVRSSNPDLRSTGAVGGSTGNLSHRKSPIRFLPYKSSHIQPPANAGGGAGAAQFVVGSPGDSQHQPAMLASSPNGVIRPLPENPTTAVYDSGGSVGVSGIMTSVRNSASNILSPTPKHSVKFQPRPKIFGGRDWTDGSGGDRKHRLSDSLTNLHYPSSDILESVSSSTLHSPKPFPVVKTSFVEWSMQQFMEPISTLTFEGPARKECKKAVTGWEYEAFITNEEIAHKQRQKIKRTNQKLEHQVFVGKNPIMGSRERPTSVLFDPLVPLMTISEQTKLYVWDWEHGKFIGRMTHPLEPDDSLARTHLANPLNDGMLMTVTNLGRVRVWSSGGLRRLYRSDDFQPYGLSGYGATTPAGSLPSVIVSPVSSKSPSSRRGNPHQSLGNTINQNYGNSSSSHGQFVTSSFSDSANDFMDGSADAPPAGEFKLDIVTAWHATADLDRSAKLSTTVSCWEQESGLLYLAGDMRMIRICDVQEERRIQDVPLGGSEQSQCHSLSSDGHMLAAGCLDGTVRIFDRLLPKNEARCMTLRHLRNPVVHVRWMGLASGRRLLIGGSLDGAVSVWDLQMYKEPIRSFKVPLDASSGGGGGHELRNAGALGFPDPGRMVSMTTHEKCDLVAVGSSYGHFGSVATHAVQIFDISSKKFDSGEALRCGLIRYNEGFMGQRVNEVSALTFHPSKLNLGIAAVDGVVAAYGLDGR